MQTKRVENVVVDETTFKVIYNTDLTEWRYKIPLESFCDFIGIKKLDKFLSDDENTDKCFGEYTNRFFKFDDIDHLARIKNSKKIRELQIQINKAFADEYIKNNDQYDKDENKSNIVIIDNVEYYLAEDVRKQQPEIFSGCAQNIRKILQKKNIHDDQYCFVKLINDHYTKSIKEYSKAKLALSKQWVENNVPNMSTQIMTLPDIAPDILNLADHEKFKNEDDTVLDIIIRGEREYDKCYFRVIDIEKAFNIEYSITTAILDKKSAYKTGIHYVYFTNKKSGNSEKNISRENVKRELYLSYTGMLRLLFASHSKNAEHFTKWAAETLFTVHLGTQEQKIKLVKNIVFTQIAEEDKFKAENKIEKYLKDNDMYFDSKKYIELAIFDGYKLDRVKNFYKEVDEHFGIRQENKLLKGNKENIKLQCKLDAALDKIEEKNERLEEKNEYISFLKEQLKQQKQNKNK